MIESTDLYKAYGSLQVLKGVSLYVKPGEIVSIVGKSGSGKSTLLQILGSLDSADGGKIVFNGVQLNQLQPKELADFRNKHIGFVFQFHHLLNEFTAIENVCMPALIAGHSMGKSEARAKELLDYLGLTDRFNHKPSQLSGGEQQRVAVARALMNNPSVIFADEPSGNLDTETSRDLHQLFFELRNNFGTTFVIVTHNQELATISDRKLTMKDGLIIE